MSRVALPTNYVQTAPVPKIVFATDMDTEGSIFQATRAVDATVSKVGASSLRIDVGNFNYAEIKLYNASGWDFSTGIGFLFKIASSIREAGQGTDPYMQVWASDTATGLSTPTHFSSHDLVFYGSGTDNPDGNNFGWQYIKLLPDNVAASNNGPLNATGWVATSNGCNFANPVKFINIVFRYCHNRSIWIERLDKAGRTRPKIIPCFDNWGQQHVDEVLPIFVANGWKASINVSFDYIETASPGATDPTPARLQAAYDAGFDITGNGLVDQPLGAETSEAAIEADVQGNLAKLR